MCYHFNNTLYGNNNAILITSFCSCVQRRNSITSHSSINPNSLLGRVGIIRVSHTVHAVTSTESQECCTLACFLWFRSHFHRFTIHYSPSLLIRLGHSDASTQIHAEVKNCSQFHRVPSIYKHLKYIALLLKCESFTQTPLGCSIGNLLFQKTRFSSHLLHFKNSQCNKYQ